MKTKEEILDKQVNFTCIMQKGVEDTVVTRYSALKAMEEYLQSNQGDKISKEEVIKMVTSAMCRVRSQYASKYLYTDTEIAEYLKEIKLTNNINGKI